MGEMNVKLSENCIYIRREYLERLYEFFPEPFAWSERAVFFDLVIMASCCEIGYKVNRNYLTARYGWNQERLYKLLNKMEAENIISWCKYHVHAPRGCGVMLHILYIGGEHGDR